MSDEEDREELRRALAGDLSRRRLVELERLASGLGALLHEVRAFRGVSVDLITRSPITVGAALYVRKLLRDPSILLPPTTVRLLRPYSAFDDEFEARLAFGEDLRRRINEGRVTPGAPP